MAWKWQEKGEMRHRRPNPKTCIMGHSRSRGNGRPPKSHGPKPDLDRDPISHCVAIFCPWLASTTAAASQLIDLAMHEIDRCIEGFAFSVEAPGRAINSSFPAPAVIV